MASVSKEVSAAASGTGGICGCGQWPHVAASWPVAGSWPPSTVGRPPARLSFSRSSLQLQSTAGLGAMRGAMGPTSLILLLTACAGTTFHTVEEHPQTFRQRMML